MMALLIGRGEMREDERIVSEGISGSLFRGRMVEKTRVGDFDAYVPEVGGTAFVTGFHQFVIDPEDPLPQGLALG
jgi:proline racemase